MVFGRSFEIAKGCLHVLGRDKEILFLPLMAAGSIFGILLGYVVSFFVYPDSIFTLLFLIPVLLFIFAFLGVFFEAGVVGMAIIRLEGGDPRVRDGLRMAASRAWPILQWAIIGLIVGVILGIIRGKFQPRATPTGLPFRPPFRLPTTRLSLYPTYGKGFALPSRVVGTATPVSGWGFGDILAGVLGMAWAVATFFVIPLIVYEKMSPIRAVRKSFEIVKGLWKETLILKLGFGAIFFLLGLLGLIFVGVGVAAAGFTFAPNPMGSGSMCGIGVGDDYHYINEEGLRCYRGDTIIANPTALLAGIGAAVVYQAFLGSAHFSMKGILRGALYTYSRKDRIEISGPDEFNPLMSVIGSLQREDAAKVPAEPSQPTSTADEIKKLAELRDRGILTEEEFQEKKKKLLEKI